MDKDEEKALEINMERRLRASLLTTHTTLYPTCAHTRMRDSHPTNFHNQVLMRICGRAKCGLMQLVRLHNFSILQKLSQMVLKSVQMPRKKLPNSMKKKVNDAFPYQKPDLTKSLGGVLSS